MKVSTTLCARAVVRALLNELGLGDKSTDASAPTALSQRTSMPTRVKHMGVRFLFLWQLVRNKDITP